MTNSTDTQILSPKGTFPATIAEVIDEYKLVMNRGKLNNIEKGQEMLVYRLSEEEIKDPDTGDSLGYLELVIGTGKVIYVQEKMSIIESDKSERILPKDPLLTTLNNPSLEQILGKSKKLPFDNPQIGDKVKPI